MALKCYTSVEKGLELKFRKFLGLISTSEEVKGKKFPILNRVKFLTNFSDSWKSKILQDPHTLTSQK